MHCRDLELLYERAKDSYRIGSSYIYSLVRMGALGTQ